MLRAQAAEFVPRTVDNTAVRNFEKNNEKRRSRGRGKPAKNTENTPVENKSTSRRRRQNNHNNARGRNNDSDRSKNGSNKDSGSSRDNVRDRNSPRYSRHGRKREANKNLQHNDTVKTVSESTPSNSTELYTFKDPETRRQKWKELREQNKSLCNDIEDSNSSSTVNDIADFPQLQVYDIDDTVVSIKHESTDAGANSTLWKDLVIAQVNDSNDSVLSNPKPLVNGKSQSRATAKFCDSNLTSQLTLLTLKTKATDKKTVNTLHGVGQAKNENVTSHCNDFTNEQSGTGTATDTSSTEMTVKNRPSVNIDKLRDRWWQLLRNRPVTAVASDPDDSSLAVSTPERVSSPIHVPNISMGNSLESYSSTIDSSYSTHDYPLHEAIEKYDIDTLTLLLQTRRDSVSTQTALTPHIFTPIQYAVHLDRPKCLRVLLHALHCGRYVDEMSTEANTQPAILMSARLGREECLQAFLTNSAARYVTTRDEDGNNILHYACHAQGTLAGLQCIVKSAGSAYLPKLLNMRNNVGETPLHTVCKTGRVDLLEMILTSASMSLLAKVLYITDDKYRTPLMTAVYSEMTDIVMTLLMWRGNNFIFPQQHQRQQPESHCLCPLLAAVKAGKLEMVQLLLEFNNPTGGGYDLQQALNAAVEIDCTDKQDVLRALVQVGANPCERSLEGSEPRCALLRCAEHGDPKSVSVLLTTYAKYLDRVRCERRADPVLQKQPESFLGGMERQEQAEYATAGKHALVTSLYKGYKCGDDDNNPYFACAEVLWEQGGDRIRLDHNSVYRLQKSIQSTKLLPSSTEAAPQNVLSYRGTVVGNEWDTVDGTSVHHPVNFHSPDADICYTCPRKRESVDKEGDKLPPDVLLVTSDGTQFHVHSHVLSSKSAKLEAAIRFSQLASHSEDLDDTPLRVDIDLPSHICQKLLEHVYYGSFVSSMPLDPESCCTLVLELLLISQEYICPTLALECELRLLSSDYRACLCYECTQLVDVYARPGVRSPLRREPVHVNGPSTLVSASTVMDIIAVASHLTEQAGRSSLCQILRTHGLESVKYGSLGAVLECSAHYLLINMPKVTKHSYTFIESDSKCVVPASMYQMIQLCLSILGTLIVRVEHHRNTD